MGGRVYTRWVCVSMHAFILYLSIMICVRPSYSFSRPLTTPHPAATTTSHSSTHHPSPPLQDDRSAVAYFPRGRPFLTQLSGTASPHTEKEEAAVAAAATYVDPEEGGRVAVTAGASGRWLVGRVCVACLGALGRWLVGRVCVACLGALGRWGGAGGGVVSLPACLACLPCLLACWSPVPLPPSLSHAATSTPPFHLFFHIYAHTYMYTCTHTDLRCEVRRGEAVRVGEEWFRVSSLEDR